MYSPFEMLRTKVYSSSLGPFYKCASLHTITNIEKSFLDKYDLNILEDRKSFISEFISIDSFIDYSTVGPKYFNLVNSFLIDEIRLIQQKGALYILRVWNLQPNL